jgi:hypothetical protein
VRRAGTAEFVRAAMHAPESTQSACAKPTNGAVAQSPHHLAGRRGRCGCVSPSGSPTRPKANPFRLSRCGAISASASQSRDGN